MLLSTFAALLQDAPAPSNGGPVKIIAGALAVVLVVIIILRRKAGGKKKEEDEF